MLDPITSANGKLDDPLMLEWALRYYNKLPQNARENRARIEATWFHDFFIAQLIDRNEAETLSNLFRYLPAQHFTIFTSLIIKHWSDWPAALASAANRVLAVNAPMELLSLFDAYLQRIDLGAPFDINRFQDIHVLTAKGTDESSRFLNRFCQKVLALPENDFSRVVFLPMLLRVGSTLSLNTLGSVFEAALRSEENKQRRESMLKTSFHGLFGHAEYLDLVFARDEKQTEQRLDVLAPFFFQDAPLDQFDQWMDSPPTFSSVVPILETLCSRSSACEKIFGLLRNSKLLSDTTRSQLAVAACIHGFARETFDDLALDLEATVNLLSADLDRPHLRYTLIEYLRTFDRQNIAAALIARLPSVKYTYGAVQLAEAMGDLEWPEFVPCLIESLGGDQKDFLCEASKRSLVEIGGSSQVTLIERWDDLDQSQHIYGLSVIRDVGGTRAADFAVTHFNALMNDNVEFCCELALVTPDQRLLDLLKVELRRKQPSIDRAYYIIARLLDRDDEDTRAAKSRALEDLRKSANISKAFNAGDFSRESLSLELRCPSCEAVNKYEAKGVIVSSEHERYQDIASLVNDEFPCASCEQEVEFEFTAMSQLAITAELMLVMAAQESGQQREPLVTVINCELDGQTMPFVVALKILRDRVSNTPTDARAWIQLGNLLTSINRPKATIEAFRQAVQMAPNAIDAKLALAISLASNNASKEAFKILSDALTLSSDWQFLVPDHNFGKTFASVYNNLLRSSGRNDLPALHPSSLRISKKIGRNDPCPCGSRKKFKKCCGGMVAPLH